MFDQNRRSREKTISSDLAFRRLIDSARSSSSRSNYWFGKVIYFYLASLKWNLQNRKLFTTISRAAHLLSGLAAAGPRLLTSEFWGGVLRPHYPRMGKAIQEAGADHLYASTRRAIDLANSKPKK
jgi:hypothetical protein